MCKVYARLRQRSRTYLLEKIWGAGRKILVSNKEDDDEDEIDVQLENKIRFAICCDLDYLRERKMLSGQVR